MTRPIDAVPLLATGRHIAGDRCPCLPIQASDLLEPGVLIRIHRNLSTHPGGEGTRREPTRLLTGTPESLPPVGRIDDGGRRD